MGRSGKLISSNDRLIESIISDPLYDIRADGTVWVKLTKQGLHSDQWRQAGYNDNGYVRLRYKYHSLRIHRIIYRKFLGPLSEDLVINHKDGNKRNNHPNNLELVSSADNNLHQFRVLKRKPLVTNCRISIEIAEHIRAEHALGRSYSRLSKRFGLSKGHISEIIHYKIWDTRKVS